MLVRINELMKSMVENGVYDKDDISFNQYLKDEDGIYLLEINDFAGTGTTLQEALDDLVNEYTEYLKEEDFSQQAILDSLSI